MRILELYEPEYHRQDTNTYCGAACTQMVLNYMGNGILPQRDLNVMSQTNTVEPFWENSPDGMNYVMNHLDRRGPGYFRLFHDEDALIITRKIIWTLHQYKIPPIVLVFSGIHWVVVFGYADTSQVPAGPNDDTYSIDNLMFYVHNPAPELAPNASNPPPHYAGDNCAASRLSRREVTREQWFRDYLTGTFALGTGSSQWHRENVAICDPEPAIETRQYLKLMKPLFPGTEILSAAQAQSLAQEILINGTFKRLKDLRLKYRNELKAGTPQLVKQINRMNSYYYLIPFYNENKAVFATVSLDARYGTYLETAYTTQTNEPEPLKVLTKKDILTILGERIEIKGKGIIQIFPETVNIDPLLVWEPCPESLDSFLPFHLVHLGTEKVYVRVDGKLFTKLTKGKIGT